MLSDKAKKEFFYDGLNQDRRKDFAKARLAQISESRDLDEYIQFLTKITKIIPSITPFDKTIVKNYRL